MEPWCERVHDLSSSVTIFPDRSISPPRFQRFYSNKYGSFCGILLEPSSPLLQRYTPTLRKTSLQAASALAECGYYGPAGFDSFVYKDSSGQEQLAPVIEINARYSMSDIAHALWNRYARHRWCLYRFISHRKCTLPDTYEKWNNLLGDDLYNPLNCMGVALLTPLRVSHNDKLIQPSRKAFFIVADSEEILCEMDKRLREKVIRV